MHGRQRSEYKAMQRDPNVAARLAQKAEQWYTLTAQIIEQQQQQQQQEDDSPNNVLALTEKLLTVNPDPLYLWNARRRTLLTITTTSLNNDVDNRSNMMLFHWETESNLTATALRNNPKAYGAWFHRKWCLVHYVYHFASMTMILKQELDLTAHFLERDERNFHCWNYRRFIIRLLVLLPCHPTTPQQEQGHNSKNRTDPIQGFLGAQLAAAGLSESCPDLVAGNDSYTTTTAVTTTTTNTDWISHEWDFTRSKIQQNFSNFSAFHYRSKLYPFMSAKMEQEGGSEELSSSSLLLLQQELDLIENAIYTEPDDQTAWWYQSFLLETTTRCCLPTAAVEVTDNDNHNILEVWKRHVLNLQALTEEVPHSKWVILGLLQCHQKLGIHDDNDNNDNNTNLLEYCHKLVQLDPDRKGRYSSLIRRIQNKKNK